MRKINFLFAFLLSMMGATQAWADELTVYGNGNLSASTTYSVRVPIHCVDADSKYQVGEYIVPAEKLTLMNGKFINSLKLYTYEASGLLEGTFHVYMKEVSRTSFDYYGEFTNNSEATNVYEGTLTISANQMNVTFSQSFAYYGGNLLIGFKETVLGSSPDGAINFIGETLEDYVSCYYESENSIPSSGSRNKFMPKTTFTFETPNVVWPKGLLVTGITNNSATLNWTSDYNKWNIRYKANGDTEWTEDNNITEKPYEINNLFSLTNYEVQIQAIDGENISEWSEIATFTTPLGVNPENDFVEDFSTTTAPSNWQIYTQTGTSWNFTTSQGFAYSGYNGTTYLIMPPLYVTDGVSISMDNYFNWASDYNGTTNVSSIVISTTGTDAEDFTQTLYKFTKDELPSETSTSLPKNLSLNEYKGQTIFIAFKNTSSNGHAWYVDNVRLYSEATPEPTGMNIYMKANGWAADNARMLTWYWGEGNEGAWSDNLTAVEGEEDIYTVALPEGTTGLKFVRKSQDSALGWGSENNWNESANNINVYDGAYYTMTGFSGFNGNDPIYGYYEQELTEAAENTDAIHVGTHHKMAVAFTMQAGKFAAICLPFATTTTALGEGVKAWAFTGYTDGNIDLSTTTELAAATPYIVYAENGINGLTFQNVTIESNEAGKVEQGAATFQGSYVKMAAGTMTDKYGVTPAGKIQKAGSGASMKAFRAYFEGITQGAKLVCDGEIIGEATGIDTIENAAQAGELYDLQGRRVMNAQKGLYIQNGKKVVMK